MAFCLSLWFYVWHIGVQDITKESKCKTYLEILSFIQENKIYKKTLVFFTSFGSKRITFAWRYIKYGDTVWCPWQCPCIWFMWYCRLFISILQTAILLYPHFDDRWIYYCPRDPLLMYTYHNAPSFDVTSTYVGHFHGLIKFDVILKQPIKWMQKQAHNVKVPIVFYFHGTSTIFLDVVTLITTNDCRTEKRVTKSLGNIINITLLTNMVNRK